MKSFVLILVFVNIANSAKILTLSIFPSYSHQLVYSEVWKELALRGHQVVSVTTHPAHDSTIPNLKEIDISFVIPRWRQNRQSLSSKYSLRLEFELMAQITRDMYNLKELHDLKNDTFDLVIAELIFPAVFGYSAYFKAPLIGINSMENMDIILNDIGNPVHPVVYPGFFVPFRTATNFRHRLEAVKTSLMLRYEFYSFVYPESNDIIKTYISPNLPNVEDIIKNTSLILVNSNFIFNKPKLDLPNIIEFSGLHVKKTKALPQTLKYFLDTASNGAIYVSFGSFIKSSMVSLNLKNTLLDTFRELPYKVMWKFEDENITNSENIMISRWLPQQDILSHKNIKAFITQGGLQSTEEAIRKRVPMIGIPFFLDQPGIIEHLSNLGVAVFVDKSTITKEKLKKVITDVAENSFYRNKMKEVADILQDEPMNSKEKVIWWIEYVLRHKGASHLRSPFLDIPWYQFFLLDILVFALLCIMTIIITVILMFRFCLQLLKMRKQKKE